MVNRSKKKIGHYTLLMSALDRVLDFKSLLWVLYMIEAYKYNIKIKIYYLFYIINTESY